ncbi:MAG: hypothetical protein K0R90_1324 [Oscillospiraceae bacterium]|jgi:hypothetical protein|nr:hypothetical protein [Oscillospiraceae bacterium]
MFAKERAYRWLEVSFADSNVRSSLTSGAAEELFGKR